MENQGPKDVLTYAGPHRHRRGWMDIVALAASVLVLAVCYIGLVPLLSSFAIPYTRTVPLGEVIVGVASVWPSELLSDRYTARRVWFFPGAVSVLIAFVVVRRWKWKLGLAAIAVIIPVFAGYRLTILPLMPAVSFETVPAALLGRADGETWAVGFIAHGTIGAWVLLWLAIALGLLLTRKRRAAQIEAAWAQEGEERIRAYDSGGIRSVEGDEVLRRVQARKRPREGIAFWTWRGRNWRSP